MRRASSLKTDGQGAIWMDKNNLQVAGMIREWMADVVR